MATIKVDYDKNTGNYFAYAGTHYIKGPDYGPVCREVNRLKMTAKPTARARKAHKEATGN